jgi:hypothetical protein
MIERDVSTSCLEKLTVLQQFEEAFDRESRRAEDLPEGPLGEISRVYRDGNPTACSVMNVDLVAALLPVEGKPGPLEGAGHLPS